MARRRDLRSGFTTGACAAAAAKGAAALLAGGHPREVTLRLPWGDPAAPRVTFPLVGVRVGNGWAACGVVKDAGDDPDVTDGLEIRAEVRWDSTPGGVRPSGDERGPVLLEGGEGVGRITKPGLAVGVGEPAINPVPRQMIEAAVAEALHGVRDGAGVRVVVSVPRGEEVARKTLNARLGILGGLSILGTTGVVIPMSADAWRATIDSGLDVARAAGLGRVVLAHGRSSEAAAQTLFAALPTEGFILMGDHVGHAVDAAAARGLDLVVAGQFAKFCKVAAGFFETHVKDSSLDLGIVSELLAEAGFAPAEVAGSLGANTAREVFQRLLDGGDRGVFGALARRVAGRVAARAAGRVAVEAVLFGYDKRLLARRSAEGA